jgi:sugar phosphate permease
MVETEQKTRPFYRGWLIVGVCLIGVSTGPAAFTLGSMGLFFDGFQTEFGWSRGDVSSALSIMMAVTAISLPFVGWLIDRFGVRRVLAPSIVMFGLLLLSVPFVTKLWQLIAIYVLIGVLGVGTNSVGYMRLLAAWFDRRRGLAIGVAGSGTGLGFAYVPVITQYAVAGYGWRGGYILLGAVMLLVTLPLVLIVLREHPSDVGLHVDGDPIPAEHHDPVGGGAGMSLAEALRRRDFWFMLFTFVSVAFVLYGAIPHLVPLLEGRGFKAETAAWIASLFGLATFGGRILIGFLIDHFEARLVAVVFFALSAVGMALLAVDLPLWAILVSALLLGGSLGAEVDMLAYLISRYFGVRCFSQIFGLMFGVVMFSMALGPKIFGEVFDRTGSYTLVILAGVPACLISMGLVSMLAPRPIRRTSDLRSITTQAAE